MKSTDKISIEKYSVLRKDRSVIRNKIRDILKSVDGCDPKRVIKKTTGNDKSLKKLGEGVYGIVYSGPVDKDKNEYVAIKMEKVNDNGLEHEFAMMKLLKHKGILVPSAYALKKCSFGNVMYIEFANAGTVMTFMDNIIKTKKLHILVPYYFKLIITQVLYRLYEIQKIMPTFRHNDLHLDNVMISREGKKNGYTLYNIGRHKVLRKNMGIVSYLSDFGFSNYSGLEQQDVISGMHKEGYGIAKNSHPTYDAHFFLNCLYNKYKNEQLFRGTKIFLETIFSPSYLKRESQHVENYRLRYNVKHSIPSIEQIFMSNYFIKKVENKSLEIIKTLSPVVPPKVLDKIKKEYFMNKDNELKIKTRKCRLYKKDELVNIAKKENVYRDKMTKVLLCKALEKKYIK